ncbi:hypothetical protein V2J09_015015 [Rumex salicifolius]
MEVGKWTSTVASIWIQASSGSSYAFSVYSSVLKSSQDYSQSTLDTISVFKDIGANAGVLSGLLYASSTTFSSTSRDDRRLWRRIAGPWLVHAVGAVQCFLGYFLVWLSVKGVIDRPPVAAMCLFMFLAAHAQTFFNTANVVTAVHNFPDYSGTAVGIMKGFLGLSGAMLIQVYDTFLKGQQSSFILMLALLPTTMSLLLMCLVKIHPSNTGKDKKYLKGFSSVALLISAYLIIVIILENVITFPESAYIAVFTLLIIFLLSPAKIAALAQKEEDTQPIEISENERNSLIPRTDDTLQEEADKPDIHVDRTLNVLQAMFKLEFWLLFVAMACGLGSGLATVNNLNQIGQSLGYSTVEINTLVSLYSIWNCLGRFGAGYLSDVFLHRFGWPRPVLMVITLGTMTIGHIIVASGFSGNLYIGTILIGVCYGSQWSLMPTITSEIFGVLHMGTIFNTIAIASPVGSYCLSVQVIGRLYDDQTDGGSSCSGKYCFMVSFFIMASVCLLACLLALVLLFRTRAFYRSVVLRRLQHFGGRRLKLAHEKEHGVLPHLTLGTDCSIGSPKRTISVKEAPELCQVRTCLAKLK